MLIFERDGRKKPQEIVELLESPESDYEFTRIISRTFGKMHNTTPTDIPTLMQ